MGPLLDAGLLFGGEFAGDLGGGADDEAAGGDIGAIGDEGPGADDGVMADDGAVHDGGAHAYEAFVFDGAGVDDGRVADGDVLADEDGEVVGEVDDGAVLHVGAVAYPDVVDISAQDAAGPDAGLLSEAHVADEGGLGGDVGGGGDLRVLGKEGGETFVEGHGRFR